MSQFKFELCPQTFDHEQTFEKHFRENHDKKEDEDENKCGICENKFKNKAQMKNHRAKYHTVKQCEECVDSVSVGNYARHKKDKHTFIPTLIQQCGICTKIFARKEGS